MSHSPKPAEVEQKATMNFPQAIQVIIDGGKVTKLEWNDPDIYLILRDGKLSIRKKEGSFHHLIVSDGDMMGTDWMKV